MHINKSLLRSLLVLAAVGCSSVAFAVSLEPVVSRTAGSHAVEASSPLKGLPPEGLAPDAAVSSRANGFFRLEDGSSAFRIPLPTLDPNGGHVQGMAAGDGVVFLAQMTRLTKVDRSGKVLAQRAVVSHTGDITWWKGELYTAVAVYPDCKEGRIEVFDANLNPVRSATIDRTIDGIACLDGVLYVGMGAKEQPSKKPHRVNVLGRFDAKTLKEIAPRQDFDYGHKTRYGFQDIATDGKLLYATFYAAEKQSPIMAVFDKGGTVVGVSTSGSNQGFDFLPDGRGLLVQRDGALAEESLPTVLKTEKR